MNWVQASNKRFMQKGLFGNPVKKMISLRGHICNCKIFHSCGALTRESAKRTLWHILEHYSWPPFSSFFPSRFLWQSFCGSHVSESNVFFTWKKQTITETNRFFKHTCYTRYTRSIWPICCFPSWSGPAPRRSPAVPQDSHHGPLSKYPSRSCRQQCDLSKMGNRFRPLNFAGHTVFTANINHLELRHLTWHCVMILLLYSENYQ